MRILSFLRRNLCAKRCDPIGGHVSPWRVWLADCSSTSLVSKVRLAFQVSEIFLSGLYWIPRFSTNFL